MSEQTPDAPLTLKTLLGRYPSTAALLDGHVQSEKLRLDVAHVDPIPSGFTPFVREQLFDFGEIAIISFLQARQFGKPLVLLPAVTVGMFHHGGLVYNSDRQKLSPKSLEGLRVGFRSYTQTTGVWIRGILADQYGVDLSKLEFITFEGPHVAEYAEPSFVKRAPPGRNLRAMLLEGEVDAALLSSSECAGTPFRSIIESPNEAALEWYRERQVVPINHMLAVTASLNAGRPDIVSELFSLFCKSKRLSGASKDGLDHSPIGVEKLKPGLDLLIKYAVQQRLLPSIVTTDELFEKTAKSMSFASSAN